MIWTELREGTHAFDTLQSGSALPGRRRRAVVPLSSPIRHDAIYPTLWAEANSPHPGQWRCILQKQMWYGLISSVNAMDSLVSPNIVVGN